MYADLQARAVDALNAIGDHVDSCNSVLTNIPALLAAREAEMPNEIPSPSSETLPPKFARIISAVSGCLNSVANNAKYCDKDNAVNLLSTCKFLDSLGQCDSFVSPQTVVEAADAIMALPAELRLMDEEGDEDGAPIKRVKLASTNVEASGPPSVEPPSSAAPPTPSLVGPTDPLASSDPSLSAAPPGYGGATASGAA